MLTDNNTLTIVVPEGQLWDEKKEEFIYINETTLVLKHSLVSISKWESKWKKPFLSKEEKTNEEILDYVRCMTMTQNVDQNVYNFLSDSNVKEVTSYISDPMSATWFSKENNASKANNREIITSELIYYMMISYNIPQEYQKWHLNRLMTLIRICSIKNAPPKKMSKNEILSRNAALNAARKSKYGTKG